MIMEEAEGRWGSRVRLIALCMAGIADLDRPRHGELTGLTCGQDARSTLGVAYDMFMRRVAVWCSTTSDIDPSLSS
ncbi:hypothetical protein MRB53_041081 [Persea americana]|nr:hypothetical protein MRB53_041081 [Persea americana]